jgi:hypothetical protein
MKGEPSRRLMGLLDLATWYGRVALVDVLVEEDFAVLFARSNHLLEARDTGLVRLWALQEAAVAANGVAHAVLGRTVEFCTVLVRCSATRREPTLTF